MSDLLSTDALDRVVPSFDDVPGDWADALRRGGRSRPTLRPMLVAAAAAAVLGVFATTSFGQEVLNGTLDRLGSWVGSAPGTPASPDQQAAFDAANTQSYAHFPEGTKVGRLLSMSFAGEQYDLFGFRDGASLCLRLLGPERDPASAAACVPQRELVDLGQPAAVVAAGDMFGRGSEVTATAVYGVAADAVKRVEIETAAGERHRAVLANNVFLYLSPGNRSHPAIDSGEAPVRAIVETQGGGMANVPIETRPRLERPTPADLPGPVTVERTLDPSQVSWLEQGEPRGAPYTWTGDPSLALTISRVVQPDSESSFKLAVAYGRSADGYERYCFVWLWPLVKGTGSYGCMLASVTGALPIFGAGVGADQFPLMSGLAADEVASLELFFPSGAREAVPLTDNVYAFQTPLAVPTKLVAYDAQHRVVGIYML